MRQSDIFFFLGKCVPELEDLLIGAGDGYDFVHKIEGYAVKHTVVIDSDGNYHHCEYHCKDRYDREWFTNYEVMGDCIHVDLISDEIQNLNNQ
jgi:hypothetical protein